MSTTDGGDRTGPAGHTYGAVLLRHEGPDPTGEVLGVLRALRFTGWVSGHDPGWLVVVAGHPGSVATGRRGVVGVAQELADRVPVPVLAVEVVRDRSLALVAWAGGEELTRYVSDPSVGLPRDSDVVPGPVGAEGGAALAGALGRPGSGARLMGLLEQDGDVESMTESERLAAVGSLLGLPGWLVSAWRLPRSVSAGPSAREVRRLGAGLTGPAALPAGVLLSRVRRRRPPPPVLTDPPRAPSPDDLEPWML